MSLSGCKILGQVNSKHIWCTGPGKFRQVVPLTISSQEIYFGDTILRIMTRKEDPLNLLENAEFPEKERQNRLLIIEDSQGVAIEYSREIRGSFPVQITRSAAEARMYLQSETSVTHVITDGLHGGWRDVVEMVQLLNQNLAQKIEIIVISGASNIQSQVENQGVRFVSKMKRPHILELIR